MQPEVFLEHLDFSEALRYVKGGFRASRAGWNGKGMFIYLNRGSYDNQEPVFPSKIEGIDGHLFDQGDTGTVTRLPNINMQTATGATVTGWLASQTDMIAEDWTILEK